MGMLFKLEQITASQLEEFLASPEKASEWVMGDVDQMPTGFLDMELSAEKEELPVEVMANLDEFASALPATSGPDLDIDLNFFSQISVLDLEESLATTERKQFFLEKDWHVLHYALCGEAEAGEDPISKAVIGGREIPDPEGVMGYGTVQYMPPEEVKVVADALATVDPKQLAGKLNPKDAAEKNIYLAHTFDAPGKWTHLPALFEDFRAFYCDAAKSGNALISQKY